MTAYKNIPSGLENDENSHADRIDRSKAAQSRKRNEVCVHSKSSHRAAKIPKIVFILVSVKNLQKNGIQICVCHFFVVPSARPYK